MKTILIILGLFFYSISFCQITDIKMQDKLIDKRDNHVYNTVKIGDQIWMAQNLNYFTSNDSYCYNNDSINCIKYGRLYTFKIAKKVCPIGWHLPSIDELDTMINFILKTNPLIKGKDIGSDRYIPYIGNLLKAADTWENDLNGKGLDYYGFNALPGGYSNYIAQKTFQWIGHIGYFWTSTLITDNIQTWSYSLIDQSSFFYKNLGRTDTDVYSVRCIKNDK